jgi:hypothetical protein
MPFFFLSRNSKNPPAYKLNPAEGGAVFSIQQSINCAKYRKKAHSHDHPHINHTIEDKLSAVAGYFSIQNYRLYRHKCSVFVSEVFFPIILTLHNVVQR